MFEIGKKVYYRDKEYKSTIGTILSGNRISEGLINLKVKSPDGSIQIIQKIYPDNDHISVIEDNYLR